MFNYLIDGAGFISSIIGENACNHYTFKNIQAETAAKPIADEIIA